MPVHPSGQIVKTRSRAHKPTTGRDLTKLFIGTEWIIWIVSKVLYSTFKLPCAKPILVIPVIVRPTPSLKADVAVAQVSNVRTTTVAVKDILKRVPRLIHPSATPISLLTLFAECIELIDDQAMGAINAYGHSVHKWTAKDLVFIRYQGTAEY